MKTAKVLEIIGANEWDWPHWKLYYINMKLDNWDTISLWKKKADAFKVGDQVSYEDYVDAKWKTKQREVKEEMQPRKTFSMESNNKWAMIGMAIKVAFEVLYDKKLQNYKECMELAHRICEDAMEMLNEAPEEENTKNDSLPF